MIRIVKTHIHIYNENKNGSRIEPCGTPLINNVLIVFFLLTVKSGHDFPSRPGSQTSRHYMSSPMWQGNQLPQWWLHPYATSFYIYSSKIMSIST